MIEFASLPVREVAVRFCLHGEEVPCRIESNTRQTHAMHVRVAVCSAGDRVARPNVFMGYDDKVGHC